MNRRVAVTACLLLLCAVGFAHADPPKPTTTGPQFGKPAWLRRITPPSTPRPEQPAPRDPAKEAESERAAAESVLYRRLAVCDRLRAVALESNDESTLQTVDRYEQEAFELYKKATAHLPCSRNLPGEDRLDRQLDAAMPASATADRLSPANPTSRSATASNTRRGNR